MVDSPEHKAAGSPLLETKLYIPKWRAGLVSRPRLIERLDQGIERKLTLVSGPAGFGKTTLLAEWVAATPASDRSAAWVSLEEPLSGRELEVLRLIAAGLSNRDIAQELVLATGTVKKHTNNIFTKLGVRSRTQAVSRRKVELPFVAFYRFDNTDKLISERVVMNLGVLCRFGVRH